MAILNITYNGMSADYTVELDHRVTDADVRRIAAEVIRSGEVRGLYIANLAPNAFANYVVDRFDAPAGGQRIYLRPKVPFGALVGACAGAGA
jgi:hypothetical protein